MNYDVVIRNGTVIDGTGMAPYPADVGIAGGRIATIGRIRGRGATEIDAEGHVVTPGFIDGHTHLDAQVFWDELGANSCWHGVTTAVMGHCGFTLAPAGPEAKELVVRNLERAEDISGAAMEAGIDWTWTTFAEYMDAVGQRPKSINYAANIGHSALRTTGLPTIVPWPHGWRRGRRWPNWWACWVLSERVSSNSCRIRPRLTMRNGTPASSSWPFARACPSPSGAGVSGPSG